MISQGPLQKIVLVRYRNRAQYRLDQSDDFAKLWQLIENNPERCLGLDVTNDGAFDLQHVQLISHHFYEAAEAEEEIQQEQQESEQKKQEDDACESEESDDGEQEIFEVA